MSRLAMLLPGLGAVVTTMIAGVMLTDPFRQERALHASIRHLAGIDSA